VVRGFESLTFRFFWGRGVAVNMSDCHSDEREFESRRSRMKKITEYQQKSKKYIPDRGYSINDAREMFDRAIIDGQVSDVVKAMSDEIDAIIMSEMLHRWRSGNRGGLQNL
jgi:hypothetical protein